MGIYTEEKDSPIGLLFWCYYGKAMADTKKSLQPSCGEAINYLISGEGF